MTAETSTRAATLAVLIVVCLIVPRALAGNVVFNAPPTQTVKVAASDVESQPLIPGVQAVGSEATTQSLILGIGTLRVYDFHATSRTCWSAIPRSPMS